MKNGRKICSVLLGALMGVSCFGFGTGVLNSVSSVSACGGLNAVNFSSFTGGGCFF